MRRTVLACWLAVLALAGSGCVGARAVDQTSGNPKGYLAGSGVITTYDEGDRRPAKLSGRTLDGGSADLASSAGRVLVLNFWASWCPPCREEADALAAVARETRALGVDFLGINVRDDDANARAFIARRRTPYPSIVDRSATLTVRFGRSVPPRAVPTTLVLDRRGRIAASIYGAVTYSRLAALVRAIAAEPVR